MTSSGLYLYTGPIVALFFALLYFSAWLYRRARLYLLILALAFFCYTVAALTQMAHVPADAGLNAVLSGVGYTLCILLLVKGIEGRFGETRREVFSLAMAITVMLLTVYFYYVDRSLISRIYAQNFGYGLICAVAALRLRIHGHVRSPLDRAFFWIFLAFGLQFFVRTALTVPLTGELAQYEQLLQAGVERRQLLEVFRTSPFWQVLNFTVFISGLLIGLLLFVAVALDVIEDFRQESSVDPLTGLLNRRGFQLKAEPLWRDAAMRPLSLVYCDIDHFKAINDSFGHPAGDVVLHGVGELLSGELRHWDVAARFGGEEFVLLLPRASGEGALGLAERIRTLLQATTFDVLGDGRKVTASFGVAEAGATETLSEVIHRADLMVYAAKRSGRDRSLLDPDTPAP